VKTTNPLVDPVLTDLYQLTMAYGYWKNGIQDQTAVFDLFFRRCPFGGEFAVFAGLEQVLRYLEAFRFDDDALTYLRSLPEFAGKEPGFFDWLQGLDGSALRVRAPREGTVVFPRVPLLRVEGPLGLCQLLETTLLTLVNYPSLVTTNAARYRLAAGWDKVLLEFGLRRSQGPDGGVSASYYSFLGGFDATSNVKAGQLFAVPVAGTHAHAFVESFSGLSELSRRTLTDTQGVERDFVGSVLGFRGRLGFTHTNEGELAAFVAYALAFPDRFTALVDTYSTLDSGVPNFVCVAAALLDFGYAPRGIRLDSGDLAFLSLEAKKLYAHAESVTGLPLSRCRVTASNDINEGILWSLATQAHGIDNFGIGTNLVTCEGQPAFGGVYKLVEIGGRARVKLSENPGKITVPGKKAAYRLLGSDGRGLVDLMTAEDDPAPQPQSAVLCRDPFDPGKMVNVVPSEVVSLLPLVWDGKRVEPSREPAAIRQFVIDQLRGTVRHDYLRPDHPARYKVSVSETLYRRMHELIARESVVKTLR
jgi:nicotinate phosphoribosyltransferase